MTPTLSDERPAGVGSDRGEDPTLQDILDKAEAYRSYARTKALAHYRMAERYRSYNTWLGVPVAIVTTIVGTSIFASINTPDQGIGLRILAGLLSIFAAVLATLQTFFNFAELAAKHQEAGVNFDEAWHGLDRFRLRHQTTTTEAQDIPKVLDEMAILTKKLDEVARSAPTVPDNVYDAARAALTRRRSRPDPAGQVGLEGPPLQPR